MRNLINSQDPHGQIKNGETEEADFNTDANEEIQPNRNTAIPMFMQEILHDEIKKSISSINCQQRDVAGFLSENNF